MEDPFSSLVNQLRDNYMKAFDQAVLDLLDVATVQEAVQKIEDLRRAGFDVVIESDPSHYVFWMDTQQTPKAYAESIISFRLVKRPETN